MGQALAAFNPLATIIILIVLAFLAILVIQFMLNGFGFGGLSKAPLAVKPKPILTDAEKAFYYKLQAAISNRYVIFPQVPFTCLVAQSGKLPSSVWGIVRNSRADFVLAHPKYLGTVAVIELDDSSHQQATTRSKDEIKNRILADAKIPMLRFRVGDQWDSTDIRTKLDQALGISQETNVRPPTLSQRPSP